MSFLYNPGSVTASDFYARGLSYPLTSYRLYDYDYALSRDPEVYERLRRDAVVAFALRYRKLLAAGRDWHLEPSNATDKDRLLVKIFNHLLGEMDYFDMARFNLAEAVIAGSRWAKIQSEQREIVIDGVAPTKWHVCTRLRDVDKRRFRQYAIDLEDTTEKVQWGPKHPSADVKTVDIPIRNRKWIWQIYRPLQRIWQEIDRDEYVRHVYDDREDTLGYGGGLASELYTYWYAKEVALQHGLQYLERWSQGIIIAKVASLRSDGKASFPTSAQRMQDWLTALEKMRSRHILIADAEDDMDVKDAPTGGWQAALEAIRYLDGAMRVAILGSTLPTSMDVEGGSYALAEVQQDTTEALARFDMIALEETLRRDLLGWLRKKNFNALKQVGLDKCTLPYIRILESRRDDPGAMADVILKCRQAGMLIKYEEAYSKVMLTPPAKGDRVLPPLGVTESERQGGGGPNTPGGGGQAGDLGEQGRVQQDEDSAEQNARNPLRPMNEKGPNKGLREKAIDHATSAFSLAEDRAYIAN
jgi:hypothetical protein